MDAQAELARTQGWEQLETLSRRIGWMNETNRSAWWLIRPRKRLSSESITKSAAHPVIWRK